MILKIIILIFLCFIIISLFKPKVIEKFPPLPSRKCVDLSDQCKNLSVAQCKGPTFSWMDEWCYKTCGCDSEKNAPPAGTVPIEQLGIAAAPWADGGGLPESYFAAPSTVVHSPTYTSPVVATIAYTPTPPVSAATTYGNNPVAAPPGEWQPQWTPVEAAPTNGYNYSPQVAAAVTYGNSPSTCARDESCFDATYECGKCCQNGIGKNGASCWDSSYTPERCCKQQPPLQLGGAANQQQPSELGGAVPGCAKDTTCFDETYTCDSCCSTDKTSNGAACWDSTYTRKRCCN